MTRHFDCRHEYILVTVNRQIVPGTHISSQLSRRKRRLSRAMVEEKLVEHGSSTATTLQRVGERFRTVPSGADRRGLSNSAAGVTTALRLRERQHFRNRQQTNRSWIHSSSDCLEDNKAYLVPKVEEKLLVRNHQISFARSETTDAETCFMKDPKFTRKTVSTCTVRPAMAHQPQHEKRKILKGKMRAAAEGHVMMTVCDRATQSTSLPKIPITLMFPSP